MVTHEQFREAEEKAKASLPRRRLPNEEGLIAATYALVAFFVYWLLIEFSVPAMWAGIAGMIVAYLIARYDSKREWDRHHNHFCDLLESERNQDA